ncbi:MAG: Holliday junction branch migration protein RuvA [Candidatus Omnitrophica bacterium]|nr:Holliday junction branch migration protein RuvA [Candidatus Omnitrophota bacterium]
MISRLTGKVVERKDNTVVIEANGLGYEVFVPASVFQRLDTAKDAEDNISLVTYHYFLMTPSSATPVLVGFLNDLEKDFFLQFISVSGIGPKAAVRALNRSIADIARAIDEGDASFLKTLPGIGQQKAKDIIAKLQGKVGRFGLIPDKSTCAIPLTPAAGAFQEEALAVLMQLQYKKPEAAGMIAKALERRADVTTVEELLNEIYRQRVQK